MSELSFKDRVVIVTGSGGGIGRSYALEYAKRGAKVVVNDLGGTLGGSGHSTRAADVVVEEIKSAGGVAVANYDSVTDGEKIVKTAIDAFGRVDVLVNNAGILRDSSFGKLTEANFQAVVDVHLNAAYKLCKAVWPYMRQQKFGRIMNTASPAGLYGNFGQTNYSAAKMGLVGLSQTLAKEGVKYNINVNVIAPLARSRMTENLIPPHILKVMGPEKVVPMVLYLTHEQTRATNGIFEPIAGYYGQVRWERSAGELFNPDEKFFTPEAILEKMPGIVEFNKNKPFKSVDYPYQPVDYNALIEKARGVVTNPAGKVKITSLKDKVVVVTGAGSGLGRSHALWFAKYGAKVLVNDIRDPSAVVNEINGLYGAGRAAPDQHDVVTDGAEIIKKAVMAFGTVDILVNNAGILRDRSFAKMTDAEWTAVMNTHLTSTFKLSKAVWPIFQQKKSGVIINTTSTSGIYGNFGQANYAAAKAAILGFSKSLAVEGKKLGIRVYVLAPYAETAMTKTIFTEKELKNHFVPSQISPLLVTLASEEFGKLYRSGTDWLYEAGGGWIGRTRFQRAKGVISLDVVAPEYIRDHWNEITDFSRPTIPLSINDANGSVLQQISVAQANKEANGEFEYNHRDVILYNISLGATTKEAKYTYEHVPNFQVLPTYPIVQAMNATSTDFPSMLDNFDFAMLLHGEQYLKINQFPIPTAAKVRVDNKVVSLVNKGKKAALLVNGSTIVDKKTNTPFAYTENSYFVRGAQVVKGKEHLESRPKFATMSIETPKTEPDFEVVIPTSPNQASLYRLSGDYNPLHVDFMVARMAGFKKPILHGLCTLGLSIKQLYDKFGAFDELKTRFSGYVFPGDDIRLRAWKGPGGTIIFEAYDINRGAVVLNNSVIKLVGSSSKL
ncbi:HGL051Wp [Eremothecium sinecaudum]|uniref:Peroxisomal hydratase-dehydrogenase-epimerase n=1 Tax=Eremothecium sinecaudum TaxID=45286 RepID=A0A0X8HVH9_9SACH|nr:HGL051Wp [Eremothecium sinecaudum]AMD22289.1 HGL051Wp [Eremothecium sinecaudum]